MGGALILFIHVCDAVFCSKVKLTNVLMQAPKNDVEKAKLFPGGWEAELQGCCLLLCWFLLDFF